MLYRITRHTALTSAHRPRLIESTHTTTILTRRARKAARDAEIARLEAEKAASEAELARQAARKTVAELFDHWARVDLINRKDGGAEVRRMFNKDVLLLPLTEN